ncbi:hypothetical protein MUG84_19760 [Paenibacillus sp. KQZ6P-2]|uniref:Uncharacterized protein n=1 Tax=Paenibacillus mangrovi TaxID=2931978 RepID=A0A9X2B812_9BACL|nr:hypothetical protein [Paenibacillus mangrovi]MCJ8013968.1 hypothetical protein [Paenibacillus mangrovi]
MQSGIQENFTWNRSHVIASGSNKVTLLVEWYGGSLRQPRKRSTPKLIAQDVQLHLWFEPQVSLIRVHGAKVMKNLGQSIMIPLGHLYDGVKQFIAIELVLQAQNAGMHGVLSAQWKFKEKNKERIKELPVKELYMNFTYHTGLLKQQENFHVRKHVMLLESQSILKEAIQQFECGDVERGEWLLRRKGDEMLIEAARFTDERLLEEADMLYQLSEHYVSTYPNRKVLKIKNG